MSLSSFIYSLTFLLSLSGFPKNRIVKTPQTSLSAKFWIDTLKHPEKSRFMEVSPSNSAALPDSTAQRPPSTSATSVGKTLIAGSDCKACHYLSTKGVGPSFIEIAQRYRNDKTATTKLATKIISGGRGVWGESMMSAHPNLSKEEAIEMVNYILSVSN